MSVQRIRIKKGLDLPIAGEPRAPIEAAPPVRSVALIGDDYVGMRPVMAVQEGDRVRLGQALFSDRRSPGVLYTSPGAGRVAAIHRGHKRVLQAVIIELDGDDEERFEGGKAPVASLTRDQVRELLLQSGLWTALRTRPFGKVPASDAVPNSIFVTAIDTQPLAVDPKIVIAERASDFAAGLTAVAKLTDGKTWLCTAPGGDWPASEARSVERVEFDGPHPAGLAGTHIHFLDPVGLQKSVWHVSYQDVIAIGRLFTTGRLDPERVVAIGGPGVARPRIVRTRLGASIDDLLAPDGLDPRLARIISGSVLTGRQATGPFAFLGRYHLQVAVVPEGRERRFLGWLSPGSDTFSVTHAFSSAFLPGKKFRMTTTLGGAPRAMVPIGAYERVMPLDIQPTFLLRSLIIGDTDQARELGCLELDEDDLGLCTYVCPSKYDYGPLLRQTLQVIEKEG